MFNITESKKKKDRGNFQNLKNLISVTVKIGFKAKAKVTFQIFYSKVYCAILFLKHMVLVFIL